MKTNWSYGRVTCREYDFSHIDSTRNLSTGFFTQALERRLLAVLAFIEKRRDELKIESMVKQAQGEHQRQERHIIDRERVKRLHEFWKIEVGRHLEKQLESWKRHDTLAFDRDKDGESILNRCFNFN